MKKEITFVIGQMGLGGAERVISVLANNFSKKNIKVNLITVIKDEIEYNLDSSIVYYNISSSHKFKLFRIIDKILKLRKLMNNIEGQTVVAFLNGPILYTLVATMFTSKKVYVSERNNPFMEPSNKILRFVRDLSYYFAYKVVFQTKDAQTYFSSFIQKKSVIIENPIEENLPDRFIGQRRNEIVLACRLDKQKNIKMFIDAFNLLSKEYPEYTAVVYGEGPLRSELEEYIKNLGLSERIFLPGFCKNLHNKMLDCAMYVSSSDYEGISNSMLEALALGIPSIVTDCPIGGAKMVIENNINGVLIPVGDYQALYMAMKKIIDDKQFSDSLSKNAVKIKQLLSVDNITKKWLDLLCD